MFVVNYRRSMPYGFYPCVARSNEVSVYFNTFIIIVTFMIHLCTILPDHMHDAWVHDSSSSAHTHILMFVIKG